MNNAGSIVTFFMIFTKRFEVLLIKPGGNGGDLTSLGILFFPVNAIFSIYLERIEQLTERLPLGSSYK